MIEEKVDLLLMTVKVEVDQDKVSFLTLEDLVYADLAVEDYQIGDVIIIIPQPETEDESL